VTSLIDTDRVIDALAGTVEARTLLTTLRPDGLAISVITDLEVYEGVLGSRDPQRAEQAFGAFLRGADVLEVTRRVAERAAAIRRELRRQRLPIAHRAMDLVIAATAVDHSLVLVSRNQRDYADIPGLLLLSSM
jgi:tRNA(fMet)-specific endonuclease VapC